MGEIVPRGEAFEELEPTADSRDPGLDRQTDQVVTGTGGTEGEVLRCEEELARTAGDEGGVGGLKSSEGLGFVWIDGGSRGRERGRGSAGKTGAGS